MAEIASRAQLRNSFLRYALVAVPLVLLLGRLSGAISGSSAENYWYQALEKPALNPPGWVFGTVWTMLYVLMGLALAIILHARGARGRGLAVGLFVAQLIFNLAWSPLFFAYHQIGSALVLLLVILALALATTLQFGRIRSSAAWLMVPYLAWLCFAAGLNFQIWRLNPPADALAIAAPAADMVG